ncbi:MAG: DUF4157 domain-containing protein [Actinoplanes sp.]
MAGSAFQSDAVAMAQAIKGFNESAEDTRSTMSLLAHELTHVVQQRSGVYQGAQAEAFSQLHSRLQDDMRVAGQELDTMSRLIGDSVTNYNTGDTEAASTFTSLSGQTGNSSVLGRLSGN